jgi:hypothetical protein
MMSFRVGVLSKKDSLDGFIPLCLANFRLLISLGGDFADGGTSNSSLNFHHATHTFLGYFLLLALLVLPAVKDGPSNFTGVPVHSEESQFALGVQEGQSLKNKTKTRQDFTHSLEQAISTHLAIYSDGPLTATRMDLVPAEMAQLGPEKKQ